VPDGRGARPRATSTKAGTVDRQITAGHPARGAGYFVTVISPFCPVWIVQTYLIVPAFVGV
jgi:hypothetical protein